MDQYTRIWHFGRIPLKPVLGGVRIVHFPLVLVNRLNETESAVFSYCRFSLFLKEPFFQIITDRSEAVLLL